MKALKYILLLLLIVVIALGIYTAVQPNEYDVSRTKLVKAPLDMVFNDVNDYKNWESWGPWYDEDPTIEATYPEQTSGIGGSYTWTSKDGHGSMKTIDMVPNKSLTQHLSFNDGDPVETNWTFEEVPEGTNVTWNMKSENVPFIFKFFGAISGGMDNMLGTEMMEPGLTKMDSVMQVRVKEHKELMARAYTLSEVKDLDLNAQKFIGFPQKTSTEMNHEQMSKLYLDYLPKAGEYAMSKQLSYEDMTPAAVFTKWDEETKQAEFYIGLIVSKDIGLAEGMEAIDLPAGKGVMISKFGQYGTGDMEAHMAIDKYLKSNNLTQNGPIWETYVNDPAQVKPEEIQTDIYYPVK